MELIVYPADLGKLSNSPFCIKAIYLMNMSGLDYKISYNADPRKAPKDKLPVLKDNGKLIPDSDQIRDHLESTYGAEFEPGLNEAQRANSQALIRMVEEHLYFSIVCDRWMDEKNWIVVRDTYFRGIPKLLRSFVSSQVRKQVIAQTVAQGMGRHSVDERFNRVKKDILAIKTCLGDGPFVHGEAPTAVDASVAAMLQAVLETPKSTPVSDFVRGDPKLVSYVERVRNTLAPDPSERQ